MRRFGLKALRCPTDEERLSINPGGKWHRHDLVEGVLVCSKGHEWKVSESIPSLVNMAEVSEEDLKLVRQYDEHAEEYDEKIKLYDMFLSTDMMREREKLVESVPLEEGFTILDVGIGTAANYMAMNTIHPDVMKKTFLYGIELSIGMLRVARRKLEEKELSFVLVHVDTNGRYPFSENHFDVVLNTGGINTHSDIPSVFSEMLRVCKPGALVLVFDEGMSPEQKKTEFGQRIISQNRLFDYEPPLDKIPREVKDLEQWWIMNDTFYAITFRKPPY